MKLKRNMGALDSILRAGVGITMFYLGFYDNSLVTDEFAKALLSVMSALILTVVIIGYCPLYALVGFDTCNCNINDAESR